MNTTSNNAPAAGIHRGVWIGGGLMALTIVALATTLVVKSNETPVDATGAGTTPPAALVANATPADTPATTRAGTTSGPAVAATTPREAEPVRATHRSPAPVSHETTRDTTRDTAPQQVAAAPVCASCGVIEGYTPVKVQGQNNGIGAVAGGVGGAVLGSQIAGRHNHTVGGIVGAIGGGLLGNAIESHERTTTVYDVRVRMDDGSTRTVRQSTIPSVGERVTVDGHALHPLPAQG